MPVPPILEMGSGYIKLQRELDATEPAPYDMLAVPNVLSRLTRVVDTMHSHGMYIDTTSLKEAASAWLERHQTFTSDSISVDRDIVARALLSTVLLRRLPRKLKKRYKKMQWDVLRKSERGAPHSLSTYIVSDETLHAYAKHTEDVRGESRIGVMNHTYGKLYGLESAESQSQNQALAEVFLEREP